MFAACAKVCRAIEASSRAIACNVRLIASCTSTSALVLRATVSVCEEIASCCLVKSSCCLAMVSCWLVMSSCWCCNASCDRITASCSVMRSRWVAMSARAPRAGPKTSARNPARTTAARPKATKRSVRGIAYSASFAVGLVALDRLVDDLNGLGGVECVLLCLERLLLVGQRFGRRDALAPLDDLLLRRLHLLGSGLLLGRGLVDLVLPLLSLALDLLPALRCALLSLGALGLRGVATLAELFTSLLTGGVGHGFELCGLAQLRDLGLTKPAGLDQGVVTKQRAENGLDGRLEALECESRRPLLVVLLAVDLRHRVQRQSGCR